MTTEELEAIHREASWLIGKRSTKAAAKALTVGSESLDKTIVEIADMYDLTPSQRRLLRPTIADEVQTGASAAVNVVKTSVGAGKVAMDAGKIAKAAESAWKTGRVGKALLTFATHGPKAAQTFANTGRMVGKFNPIVLGLTVAWTVGSTGWFAYHARAFNLAAYEMKKRELAPDNAE
jgi:hypothetical protein